MVPRDRSRRYLLFVVLPVYIVAFFVLRPDRNPETWEPGEIAAHLVAGNGFSLTNVDGVPRPTANQEPVYPLLLAAFSKWLPSPYAFLAVFQILLWLGTARLLGGLAQRLAGAPESPTTLAVALWPPLLVYVLKYHPLTLRAALLVFVLVAADAYRRSPSAGRALVAGGVLGLAALVRATFLALPLLVLPWAFRKRYGHQLLALVTAGAVLSPWVVRNRLVLDAWVPGTTTAGQIARAGNYPGASGALDEESSQRAMLELTPELWRSSEPVRDRFFRERVLAFWLEAPLEALYLYLRKILYLWTWRPGVGSEYPAWATFSYLILWVVSLVLIPYGWRSARREETTAPSLFLATWAFLSLIYAFFVVNLRFRFEAEPLLVPYVVVAARAIVARFPRA